MRSQKDIRDLFKIAGVVIIILMIYELIRTLF